MLTLLLWSLLELYVIGGCRCLAVEAALQQQLLADVQAVHALSVCVCLGGGGGGCMVWRRPVTAATPKNLSSNTAPISSAVPS
jgi:hypothetical protein